MNLQIDKRIDIGNIPQELSDVYEFIKKWIYEYEVMNSVSFDDDNLIIELSDIPNSSVIKECLRNHIITISYDEMPRKLIISYKRKRGV